MVKNMKSFKSLVFIDCKNNNIYTKCKIIRYDVDKFIIVHE